MAKRRRPKPALRAAAALLAGCCALAALVDEPLSFLLRDRDEEFSPYDEGVSGRRALRNRERSKGDTEDRAVMAAKWAAQDQTQGGGDGMYAWARHHLRPLSTIPDPSKEVALFWHIPKSGGSTAKSLYRCLGKSIDIESQPKDIMIAKELQIVSSGKVDLIFSSFPDYAITHLYDKLHKGRALAMFRHPVERLISKFYYLQIATWERTFRPEWKGMDILEWIDKHNLDNDHMTKKLAGKVQRSTATEDDLRLAMRTIKARFVVGLMSEMEESVQRFNVVLGIDEEDRGSKRCMDQYFGSGNAKKKTNSNKHPKVETDGEAWQLLAERNALDIRLYDYVVKLFEEQRGLIETYRSALAEVPEISPPVPAASS